MLTCFCSSAEFSKASEIGTSKLEGPRSHNIFKSAKLATLLHHVLFGSARGIFAILQRYLTAVLSGLPACVAACLSGEQEQVNLCIGG